MSWPILCSLSQTLAVCKQYSLVLFQNECGGTCAIAGLHENGNTSAIVLHGCREWYRCHYDPQDILPAVIAPAQAVECCHGGRISAPGTARMPQIWRGLMDTWQSEASSQQMIQGTILLEMEVHGAGYRSRALVCSCL